MAPADPPQGFDLETVEQQQFARAPAISAREVPELSFTDGKGSHRVPLIGRAVLGSSGGVDIAIADPAVSRLHAELEVREDGVWVRDLGSRNGTFVEGVCVGSARIAPGASLRVGSTLLTLGAHSASMPVELWPTPSFGPLVGRSVAMRELFVQLSRCAASSATVLLQGETGTGKDLVARALHEASPRAAQPFSVVDCAGLPEHLLEAELFGHAKGAFTGAVEARAGIIEESDGGTVFLDEVGELGLAMQPKLLRMLETRSVRRVGGASGYQTVDVRFISATHRDLREMVNTGAFREDLYFRLAVLPLTVPPLRARREDVPLLAAHFLHQGGGSAAALSGALLDELATRPWLGNVRELRNFIERAVALGPEQALSSLPASKHLARSPAAPSVEIKGTLKEAREQWTDRFEREYLSQLLDQHARDVPSVARAAGVDRTYVYRLLRKHGI